MADNENTENTEISFTDPQEILDSTMGKIEEFKEAKDNLNRMSIKYIRDYDTFNLSLKDGTLLRQRMKDAVIKAVPDEL